MDGHLRGGTHAKLRRVDRPTKNDRVAALLPGWGAWLRAKHRPMVDQHADLTQQAASDLLQWLEGQGKPISDEVLRQVGFRILQRRVADAFRAQVARWGEVRAEEVPDQVAAVADPSLSADPPRALHHARFLKALVSVLAELEPEDRALLVGEELGQARGPLTSAERMRLHRLRETLRERLRRRFGIAVDDKQGDL